MTDPERLANGGLEAPPTSRPPPLTLRKESSDNIPIMPASLRSPRRTVSITESPVPPESGLLSHPPPKPLSPPGARGISARSPSAGPRSRSPAPMIRGDPNEPRQIIINAFAPRVLVLASEDTENLARSKGVGGGLRGLLQGFADRIQGKVIIRDSIGSSKAYDDFGIRLTHFGDDLAKRSDNYGTRRSREFRPASSTYQGPRTIDNFIQQHLAQETSRSDVKSNGYSGRANGLDGPDPGDVQSTAYQLYLRALLSDLPLTPFESFAHPVACIIAVSSRNHDPTETLRNLYAQSSGGIPRWVSVEYLRYYVVVHDEEQDDITKTTALFESMKRHFGLHCHLLRLRSTQCVATDDDSVVLPKSIWLPAREQAHGNNLIDDGDDGVDSYIFGSDAGAIRTFLREMVTQSVVPFMESRMMTWNDQVASKRKGISGRFMSLSKRWTGFGSIKGSKADSSSSNSNYDAATGTYSPESPEYVMRQLADFAFMLRDFKLAYNTYDIIRSDFAHDKAWAHHAAANEMAATTYLALPPSARFRADIVDALLDTASYSYLTRCEMPANASRALIMGMELLKIRRTDDAPRWGGRLLELGILSPVGQTMVTERMAESYRLSTPAANRENGNRIRQAAFWSVLAAQSWVQIRHPEQAERCMRESLDLLNDFYDLPDHAVPFENMIPFRSAIMESFTEIDDKVRGISLSDLDSDHAVETSQLVAQPISQHRRSISESEARKSATYGRANLTSASILSDQQRPADDGFE